MGKAQPWGSACRELHPELPGQGQGDTQHGDTQHRAPLEHPEHREHPAHPQDLGGWLCLPAPPGWIRRCWQWGGPWCPCTATRQQSSPAEHPLGNQIRPPVWRRSSFRLGRHARRNLHFPPLWTELQTGDSQWRFCEKAVSYSCT